MNIKMEENKKIMEGTESQPQAMEESQKMTYEQLEQVAHQLSEQARQLYRKLQEANMINMFKRLDYLFKVVENKDNFGEEFVHSCVAEIQDILTVTDEAENEETDK